MNFALLIAAHAVLPYYSIENRMSSLLSFEYHVTWEEKTETFCSHTINIPAHPTAAVRAHQCYAKCAHSSGNPQCSDYHANVDGPDDDSLCAPLEVLLAMCQSLEDCWGVTHNTGLNHGYLNTNACGSATHLHTREGRDVYVKTLSKEHFPDECHLGVGAELTGGKVPEVEGVYEKIDDKTFAQVDPPYDSKITWHYSGCGWVVVQNTESYHPPVMSPPTVCQDDNKAANILFEQTGADAVDNICEVAGVNWGPGSYCKIALFAQACAASCKASCSDSDRRARKLEGSSALEDYFAMTDLEGEPECSQVNCADPVHSQIFAMACPTTCSSRRLATHELGAEEKIASALKGRFRTFMADYRLNHFGKNGQALHPDGRRLGFELTDKAGFAYEELYMTFNPDYKELYYCDPKMPVPDLLHAPTIFAVKEWNAPIDFFASMNCPSQSGYSVSMEEGFCIGNNHAAAFNKNPDVVKHSCYHKCNLVKKSEGLDVAVESTIDEETGENDYCAGNSMSFTNATNALCLPREECERLCTELGPDCHSFDMHRKYPQCYLNINECESSDPSLFKYNMTWDVIHKVTTSDETTNVADDYERDVYGTITGVTIDAAFIKSLSGRTRSSCELHCSTSLDKECYGFVYTSGSSAGAGSCDFFGGAAVDEKGELIAVPITDAGDMLDMEVALRSKYTPCTLHVMAAGPYDNVYMKGVSNTTFLSADNKTRFKYVMGNVTVSANESAPECDGWLMEKNSAPMVDVWMYNCSDSPVGAAAFLSAGNGTEMASVEFPCQWGKDTGMCDDITFSALCPHTCKGFSELEIAGETYVFQNLSAYSTCFMDDDAAIAAYADGYGSNCYDVATNPSVYNATHAPCSANSELWWNPIMRSVCKWTCFNLTTPTIAAETATITDEGSPAGSQWPDRRLAMTVSHSGGSGGVLYASYLAGDVDDYFWTAEMRSWKNGSDDAYSREAGAFLGSNGLLVPGMACTGGYGLTQSGFIQLTSTSYYSIAVPTEPSVKMKRVCREVQECPELTTCVLSGFRFAEEMARFRKPGMVSPTGFVGALDAVTMATVMEGFVPKVISSENRAEAYIAGGAESYPAGTSTIGEIFRSVPGATRIQFDGSANFGMATIVTMVSATADMGAYAFQELGRDFKMSSDWSAPVTDVIRIERFGGNGDFTFQVYAPHMASMCKSKCRLFIYRFAPGSMEPTLVSQSADMMMGAPAVMSAGAATSWFKVTIPGDMLGADFVGVVDVDECGDNDWALAGENPCHHATECHNKVGAPAACTCPEGTTADDPVNPTMCMLNPGPKGYNTDDFDSYFKLEHLDPLHYGWRVAEIEMRTGSCTGAKISSSVLQPLGGDPNDETYAEITSVTKVYTGEKAYSHYPSDPADLHWNGKIFDDDASSDWWSGSLSLNPEVQGAGAGASILWAVSGEQEVDCVKVLQSPNHPHATKLRLSRGPIKGPGCGTGPTERLCEPTETWEATADQATEIPTDCGIPNTQIFGEMMELPGDGAPSWIGSYADNNPVPSACHCKALCLKHLAEGCRSFKYYEGAGIQHCYLQSNVFKEGEGYWGVAHGEWPGWQSGTTGRRILGFSPAVVAPGQEFTLTIHGVELPFDESARFNTAPRQRMKIMPVDKYCYEEPPEEVTGIGCTETTRKIQTAQGIKTESVFTICSPRPSETSSDSVSFSDITIAASSVNKAYKVCYCATQCYEPSSYVEIPGTLAVDKSTFTWALEVDTVYRKEAGGPTTLNLMVHRPPFFKDYFSNAKEWEVKIVRDYYGCDVVADESKFSCKDPASSEAKPPVDVHDSEPPKIIWEKSIPTKYPSEDGNESAPVYFDPQDAWLLTFDEVLDPYACDDGATFTLTIGGSSSSVKCSEAVIDGNELYLYFSGLSSASGTGTLSWSDGAVYDFSHNGVVAGSADVKFVTQSLDSTLEILASSPMHNGQYLGGHNSNITLYLSAGVGSVAGAGNLTFADCGHDGICGSSDDIPVATAVETGSNVIRIFTDYSMLSGRRFEVTIPAMTLSGGGKSGPEETYTVSFMSGCPLPTYLANPDVGHWVYELDLDVEDTGSYLVCFREGGSEKPFVPIPSETDQFLTISKIEADRTHPRGIFHNQYFSALSGSVVPNKVKVAGTRMAVPTDSKIVISADPSGKCGDSRFAGVPVMPSLEADVTPPVALLDEFFPQPNSDGSAFSMSAFQAISMKFSEAVQTYPACFGNISFVPTDSALATHHVDCSLAIAVGSEVIIPPPGTGLAQGTFYLKVETGAVKDLAGNAMPVLFTYYDKLGNDDDYTFSYDGSSDSTEPEVLNTFPSDGSDSQLAHSELPVVVQVLEEIDMAKRGATVVLYMSEPVSIPSDSSAFFIVQDCGMDYVCQSSDYRFDEIYVTDGSRVSTSSTDGLVYIYVGELPTFKRYKMTVPVDVFSDGTNTGPSQAYSFEFTLLGAGTTYSYKDMALTASMDSTDESLIYDLSLASGISSSELTVCYCSDQKDETLEDLGNGDTTYKIYEDLKCSNSSEPVSEAIIADRSIAEHACEAKCSRGCSGPFCYCDGFDSMEGPNTLCLPPSLCREACDALDDCGGINVHDSKPQCLLIPAASQCDSFVTNGTVDMENLPGDLDIAEEWQLFTKHYGTACTNLADYQERAGSLFVTSRVEVGVDYVLHPGQLGSIELTTPVMAAPGTASLAYEHNPVPFFTATKLLTRDRITVIDCKGTCGVSSPTTAVTSCGAAKGEDCSKIETWNDYGPYSWFVDLPSIDRDNKIGEQLEYHPAKKLDGKYMAKDGFFCPQGNIDLDKDPQGKTRHFPFGGIKRPLKEHQCFTKCSLNAPCEDDDCYCDGHYSGYDAEESNALCASKDLCEYLCDNTPGCGSIDMHKTLPRCFLNMESQCSSMNEDYLAPDFNYELLVPSVDSNDEQAGAPGSRRLLPAADLGFSWENLMRFRDITFKSGGTFKLCFCDSTILGSRSVCSSEKDYKIEVGTIHASGVSCLIANPKLQRVSCEDQKWGGLRCYSFMDAPKPPPPLIGLTEYQSAETVTVSSISANCLFMPEEEARNDPMCQAVAAFQSTDPTRK
jgi:hypothetical protein